MSLIRRMLLSEGGEEMTYAFEKIFETEFTLDTTITSSGYTTITTINTGLKEGDLEIGEVLIAEIRLLEYLDPDNTLLMQNDRFEFLYIGTGGYCTAGYMGGNPGIYTSDDSEVVYENMMAAGGVFVYKADKYMSILTISGRNNGNPKPVAGRYQLLLYRTGMNFRKDYRV